MKKNKVTRKDVLFLSISLFAVVFFWVAFSIYHAWVASTITDDLQLQIIPIASKFDTTVIDKLKKREKITPLFDRSGQPSTSSSAERVGLTTTTPTPPPTEEALTPTIGQKPTPTTTITGGPPIP